MSPSFCNLKHMEAPRSQGGMTSGCSWEQDSRSRGVEVGRGREGTALRWVGVGEQLRRTGAGRRPRGWEGPQGLERPWDSAWRPHTGWGSTGL